MKIKLTESKLKHIVAESVKKVISEARKPSDRTVGKHTLKGLRYDKNGNPLYTSDTMSDDEKKNQGWRFSKKHGLYGQLSDPTKLSENSTNINEIISADYSDALKQLLTKSFGNLNDNEKAFLSDLLNNEPWETIYTALNILGQNRVNESHKKREPRKGTIELNGKHIDAVEDGLDKNGNPMYKVNDPSIKGRRCKDGSIRVQHYNFKPNRVNELKDVISTDSIYNQVLERIVDFLERGDMEIKWGDMNGQSFDVYLPPSEKYLEIVYMGDSINIPLSKRVEDLSDESITRCIMKGFVKLYNTKQPTQL